MNLSSWSDKLKASAAKAAESARSFQGFDSMAAEDEYIHTEFERVPVGPPGRKSKTRQENGDVEEARPTSSVTVSPVRQGKQVESSHSFLSVVQTTLAEPAVRQPAEPIPYDDEEDVEVGSDSDDDEYDPILARMGQGERKALSRAVSRPAADRKKKNRFLTDLDQRVATSNQDAPQISAFNIQSSSASDPSQQLTSPLGQQAASWLKNTVRGGNLFGSVQAAPRQPAPLSRSRPITPPPPPQEDDFEITVLSSSILGDDEREALQRLKQKDDAGILFRMMHHHARELFVGFTLVLAAYVYFASPHASDSVT